MNMTVNFAVEDREVVWIPATLRRSICDVPWTGTTVVLSNGNVHFCCFSSAIAGNVNDEPFEQIWNGRTMQRIRHELSEQRLPPECQSTACPIYRGDALNDVTERMGAWKQNSSGNADIRQQLNGSILQLKQNQLHIGDALDLGIHLQWRGSPIAADLFIAIRQPDGLCRFLPDYEEYAVPFRCSIELREDAATEIDARARFGVAGAYRICAALFARGSNPNLLSNCYWSQIRPVTIVSDSST